ncbi:uncharacterized protein LOC144139714 [Haemaphysalis longicornis]
MATSCLFFIKILKLNIGKFRDQMDLGEAISTMVHLEELECTGHAGVSHSCLVALRTLVASTSSLSTLFVHGWPHECCAVKSSSIISTVSFKTRWLRRIDAFLHALAADIGANYKLLCVAVNGPLQGAVVKDWFNIWDTTRRNTGLVARAARFVSGAPCGRCGARALEWVFDHPVLPEEIAKLASVSEAEATTMARRSLADMQPMLAFMRLTGVVKNELVFEARGPRGPRLDVLNEDCWRHVRSFLKLEDVKDSDL